MNGFDKPSIKSERFYLKQMGAKIHPRSGRGKILKADGSTDMFVIDVKEAEKSFTLNDRVWTKVTTDAYKVDSEKYPMLLLVIGNPKRRLVVMDYEAYEVLINGDD